MGVVGKGSFGVVFKTQLVDSDQPERIVALKKVLQDRRYKVLGGKACVGGHTGHK